MEQFRPDTEKALLHFLIERHVRAPEPVDRLLRIADQEKLAGDRTHCAPVRLAGVVCGEKRKDLGLEGISVLEFVDEKVREALLQLAAHAGMIANEIAHLDEEVEEIEPPRLGLQEFVVRDWRLQSVVEQGSEIGVARSNEGVQTGLGLV